MQNGVYYENLNPLAFLQRSALAYPDKTAIVYNEQSFTYTQFYERVKRLAAGLREAGIRKGDRVAFLVPNLPPMLEGHFGPLYLGAVLVAINTRLSPRELGYILEHSGAKILVFDSELAPVVREARGQAPDVTMFVQVVDTVPKADDIDGPEYEEFLANASRLEEPTALDSELDTIAINYTSGTTGLPKGVEYHARGAYLAAISEVLETGVDRNSAYLWTLPMFHCNGWCHTWGVTAMGAKHVCLRKVDPDEIFRLIKAERVTNMCCAPTVLTMLYSSPAAKEQRLEGLTIMTAGASPSPQHIKKLEEMGALLHHTYGLTETFGPHTICAIQPGWDELPVDERARLKTRQGVPFAMAEPGLRVVNPQMEDIPKDGETMGEVIMRGNSVMKGYYNDPEATVKAFEGGWFHSGDLAVWHPDGVIELKDRSKDIIISGGENISTQEIEKVIMEHPGVLEVCVVGVPDDRWGEVPKAFVTKQPDDNVSAEDIIEFCRDRIARFKAPKYVEFGELPKTATGKVQKFVLREKEWAGREKRIN
ncbi:MAG: long-chain-fatty-acid--CoA ligase [Chloroflexi bacterium]|nr:long-chain-fatty-acid--CoA ligase [Chloroflexota bacterium]